MSISKHSKVSILFILSALISFYFSDLSISTTNTSSLINKFLFSIVDLKFNNYHTLLSAFLSTIFIAVFSIFMSAIIGFLFALVFNFRIVQIFLAFLRSIHELFWALIFLQIFGLNTITALLAIIIPYSAILGKVYAEILEQDDKFYDKYHKRKISLFLYTKIPNTLSSLLSYTFYRFECALRSSAILGFVGIPTLGYYLSSSFMQGLYNEVWLMLILFYILIASIKFWLNRYTFVFLLICSFFYFDDFTSFNVGHFIRFITNDIVPYPIRNDLGTEAILAWLDNIFFNEILIGTINTIFLTQISLVLSAFFALLAFPLLCLKFVNQKAIFINHIFFVVLRSTPEYILAYIFLQMFGPSMLPAALALMLHNGSIISHLLAKDTNIQKLGLDTTNKKVELYFYYILPNMYNKFLIYLFYRWEIIMRESAILGILGITTLGFYIDSAFADFRLDKMFLLLLVCSFLNISIDFISRKIRSYLQSTTL